jgi:hypothetical protein
LSIFAAHQRARHSNPGWIHSKKRNRLSQLNVNRLLRAHTNLILLAQMEDWESKVLPWDIEMIIDEGSSSPCGWS